MLRSRFVYESILLAFVVMAIPCQTSAVCLEEVENATILTNQIDHEWPLRPVNDRVTEYIQHLGELLVFQVSSSPNSSPIVNRKVNSWVFTIVRDFSVNAFSIGNGRIYITDGSLTITNSEDELAAILSHEIGHQVAGHFCEKSNLGGFEIFSNVFDRPKNKIGIGSMSLTLDPIKEQQADHIAIQILRSSGYDPRAILTIAKRLPSSYHHLVDQNRINFLDRETTPSQVVLPKRSEEYLAIQKNLKN